MEANEGRPSGRSQKEQKPVKGGLQTRFKSSWLGRNWGTVLVLVAVIFIALFVRSYFGFSTAVDNGFLLAGGSDSYYHLRVIEHVEETGSHLVYDPLLNYPLEIRNMRPPIYDWSVAVTSMFISGVSGLSSTDSIGYTFLFSTAFWGALTCIPVFLLTRAAFGNRAGLLASLLFALMPGNITRSVFANADHDAMILFFVVFALYFLLRALMTINGTKWVTDWKSLKTIRSGISSYLSSNKRSLIYAMLGGVCISVVAMTWTGYTYILVIILVYFLVQILINRFRNIDSMGEFFLVGTMLMTAFVLMAPLYWQMNYWNQWFDVPFYLFLGAMVVGGIFMVSRDYPWTLAIPAVIALIAVGMVAIFFVAPNIFEAIISGQGYLVKSKLYSTIAEAQAPTFSDLAMSFGVVTFWFALIGVVWAAVKIPKNPSPYLVFIVVWLGVSIYMAASAGRFMFNASPAFAMAAGWILALLIAMVKFEEVPRAFGGFMSNPWTTIKKAVKLRHVAAALFLAFLIVLPNAWGALDAGIPSEIKRDYDKQIYYALPDILHPSNYDRINGSYWYLGAFSYSMPLPETYYPAAWSWFSTQDTDLAIEDRPAYLSWWDYGFEAVQSGRHPTVADNFQNGYQYAGSFLMSENESDAIALLIVRVLEKTGFNSDIKGILESHGADASAVQDIMQNPGKYVQTVLDNPGVYGNFSQDLSAANAKYAAARIELQKVGKDNLVNIYHDIRKQSGYDIGYVAVDSRLFPFSATSNNIFYAPAKLSDRQIDALTNAPTNYYSIKAVLSDYRVVEVKDVRSTDNVIAYQIYYTDVFYKTMLYRTFMGLSPQDVGATSQGIPGISGSMTNYNAMPGFNLTHFKQVYRTAYFNPYNNTDVANHSDAWRAVSYEEAKYLQAEIAAGNITGTVDMSSASLQSGVVFIQYYDGAVLQGKATSNDGTPYGGIYVTVVDEHGIPHQTVRTANDGSYSVYLPFGDISVVYSAGTLTKSTQIATEITRTNYTVSYAQAQRMQPFNADGNITLPGSSVGGTVFWDNNGDGRYSPGDEYMVGATVTLENNATGFKAQATTDTNGAYSLVGLAGEPNFLSATYNGHQFGGQSINMAPFGSQTKAIPLRPASINGTLTFSNGDGAPGVPLSLTDKTTGKVTNVTSAAAGKFLFGKLLPGEYSLTTSDLNLSVGTQTFNLTAGSVQTPTLSMYAATQVSGTVSIDGQPQANVAVTFLSNQRELFAITDSAGKYTLTLPQGTYTAYALSLKDGVEHVAMEPFNANENVMTKDLPLSPGTTVTGTVRDGSNAVTGASVIYAHSNDGTFLRGTTNSTGGYRLVLPADNYFVYAKGSNKAFWGTASITGSTVQDLGLMDSVSIAGKAWYDANGNSNVDNGEAIANAVLKVQSTISPGHAVYFLTDPTGSFNITLPKGNGYVLSASKPGYGTWTNTYDPLNSYVSVNIPLVADNRTVNGTVTADGNPVSGIVVQFQPQGATGQAASVTTDAAGTFELSLKPGNYKVVIDQNVSNGDDSSKYQYTGQLSVSIGRDPDAMAIALTERFKVNGTIDMGTGASGTLRFIGQDNRTVNASPSFTHYLVPGDYSVYVDLIRGGRHYVDLSAQNLSSASTLTITPQWAQTMTGQLRYDGADLKVPAAITIASGGASYTMSANSQGRFVTHLVNGTYDVDAEYHTQATVNGTARYVVYTGAQNVNVSGDVSPIISMSRNLDNSTLSGSISGASGDVSWTFTALSTTAMDHTATSGSSSYLVDLAPGTYSVYGIDGANNVYMGTITVEPNKDSTVDLNLQAGTMVEGTVTYQNDPVSGAKVVFNDGAVLTVTTDGNGDYLAYLPAGLYNVSASWVREEVPGVNVTYARSFDLNLTSQATRDIQLVRQLRGAVELKWASAQQTVNAGESVTYDIIIYNRGNVDDTYGLSSDSTWGVTFSQKTVSLPWGANSSQTVQVTIKTPADAKVTHSPIRIKATSHNNTGAQGTVNTNVGIVPVYGVSLSLGSPEVLNQTSFTYPFQIKNTGNADDTYNLTLSQAVIDALAVQGWDARISGTPDPYKVVSVNAGSSQTVKVVLTKNRENPEPNASLAVGVSSPHTSASADIPLEKGSFSLPDQGLKVNGDGISMSAPQIPASSWFLIAMIMLLFVVLVILRVNKGVFGRRRKR